jgi:hypothetical protein
VKAALLLLALLVAVAAGGCGGDDEGPSTPQGERNGGSSEESTPESGQPGGYGRPAQNPAQESRPSRRDVEVNRQLERHLRQRAAGVSSGWRFADVEDVQVRGTSVAIQTRLGPARREAAASLCLAARRFFLQGGQSQTPYDVLVTGPDGSTLGMC